MNYESLQPPVGGSAGSRVSVRQKRLRLGRPVHWRPEQKPFTSTWQPLPVLKTIVWASAITKQPKASQTGLQRVGQTICNIKLLEHPYLLYDLTL